MFGSPLTNNSVMPRINSLLVSSVARKGTRDNRISEEVSLYSRRTPANFVHVADIVESGVTLGNYEHREANNYYYCLPRYPYGSSRSCEARFASNASRSVLLQAVPATTCASRGFYFMQAFSLPSTLYPLSRSTIALTSISYAL